MFNIRDLVRRAARCAPWVPVIIVLQLLNVITRLRVAYTWSTPTAAEVVANYARGLVLFGRPEFPWTVFEWREFPARAVITRETAKVPKTLRSVQRRGELEVRFDQDFEAIILACREGRTGWLTPALVDVYRKVHKLGFVRTVGMYRDGQLVAGLWGIGLGGVFGIMSMFHRENSAGALAVAALVDLVSCDGGWSAIDSGGMKPNFAMYGAREIPRAEFCELVLDSLHIKAPMPVPTTSDSVAEPAVSVL